DSSHGCTTTVVAGGTCLARPIRRSYFAWVWTTGAAWVIAITKLLRCSRLADCGSRRFPGFFAKPGCRHDLFGLQFAAEQAGNAVQPVCRFSGDLAARAQHLAQRRKRLAALLTVFWK